MKTIYLVYYKGRIKILREFYLIVLYVYRLLFPCLKIPITRYETENKQLPPRRPVP